VDCYTDPVYQIISRPWRSICRRNSLRRDCDVNQKPCCYIKRQQLPHIYNKHVTRLCTTWCVYTNDKMHQKVLVTQSDENITRPHLFRKNSQIGGCEILFSNQERIVKHKILNPLQEIIVFRQDLESPYWQCRKPFSNELVNFQFSTSWSLSWNTSL